jgi:peptidoglycan/LPS O-acetylase OafA/YrhL
MHPENPRDELLSIQALRGVAVLAVVLMHVAQYSLQRLGLSVVPLFDVGAAGVDLFFVISGFVIVYASERLFGRPGSTRIFLLRRLIRIVPIYWIATTLALAYLLAQYHNVAAATGGSSWSYLLASYLFWPAMRRRHRYAAA